MLSLRIFARQAPRSVSRLSSTTVRSAFRPAQLQAVACRATAYAPQMASCFSTSSVRAQEGESNVELAAKLNSEIALEKDNQEDSYRESITDYLENSEYQIEDVEGHEEVHLTRTFGEEHIKVTFSVADFNTFNEVNEEEDPALYDEDEDALDMPSESQSGGANTKGAINQGRTAGGNIRVAPEDGVSPADRPELDDEEDEPHSFPAHLNVTATRPGKGAVTIECLAREGEIIIENVYHFPTAELAEAKTAEQDWARRSLYTGPPFSQLDEDLQLLLDRYLEERGINTTMALFIPDYIDMKEQKEYIRWLGNMKSFVE